MIVAAHQPNYLPWLGQFVKIANCDLFVFCDLTQYQKWGYHNRVQVKCGQRATWLSVPVAQASHFRPIREAEIAQRKPGQRQSWYESHLEKLESYYRTAPYCREVVDWLAVEFGRGFTSLAELNIHLTCALARRLGITTTFGRTEVLEGRREELPVEIARRFGASAFVRGWGAADYQDDRLLEEAGILSYEQVYEHAVYPQVGGAFVPGLSVVDALCNVGWEGTLAIIREKAGRLRRCGGQRMKGRQEAT